MTPRAIITATEQSFGLAPGTLRGPLRGRTVLLARRVAAFLACERTPASYAEVGEELGRTRQDVHAIVSRADASDPELVNGLESVERLLVAAANDGGVGGE